MHCEINQPREKSQLPTMIDDLLALLSNLFRDDTTEQTFYSTIIRTCSLQVTRFGSSLQSSEPC